MRRTQTCRRSPRWLTAREVHQCSLGVFRNTQCIRYRFWHSHRWATAPRAASYCSELKKMVGSPSLTLIPDLPFQRLARHTLLSELSRYFPSEFCSRVETSPQNRHLFTISACYCATRVHISQMQPL